MDDVRPGDAHSVERNSLEEKYQALISQIPTRLNQRKQMLPDFVLLQIRPDLEMEYQTLRGEILERVKLRQQLTSLILTISGAFLAFGLTNASVAFVFPPLAALLALAWTQNDSRIREAATHISMYIEQLLPGLAWESSRHKANQEGTWLKTLLAHSGIFVMTQSLAVIVGAFTFSGTGIESVLLVADMIAIAYVIWLFRAQR